MAQEGASAYISNPVTREVDRQQDETGRNRWNAHMQRSDAMRDHTGIAKRRMMTGKEADKRQEKEGAERSRKA
jgi:hypothetical protein